MNQKDKQEQQQKEESNRATMVVPRRSLRDLFSRENSRSASLRSLSGGAKEDSQSRSHVSPHRRRRRSSPHPEQESHDHHVSFAEPVAEIVEEEQREEEGLTEEEREAYFYTVGAACTVALSGSSLCLYRKLCCVKK